ncbi:unnamed protein product [Adineta ricciae]|uniref:Uncharacterized protein n=1 Tax=Adineta ricciae TaxID=249248 RepID=A0A815Q1P0_ADIRI|nr:unnamed protein product [Adineta ricciae]CAF1456742.1 unnamed protein product [Adineta ricciae]
MAKNLSLDDQISNHRKYVVSPSTVRSRSAEQIHRDRTVDCQNRLETNRRNVLFSIMEKELRQEQIVQRIRMLHFLNNLKRKHPLAHYFLPHVLSSDVHDLLTPIDFHLIHSRILATTNETTASNYDKRSRSLLTKISEENNVFIPQDIQKLTKSEGDMKVSEKHPVNNDAFSIRYQQLQLAMHTHKITGRRPVDDQMKNIITNTRNERIRAALQRCQQAKLRDTYESERKVHESDLATRVNLFLK